MGLTTGKYDPSQNIPQVSSRADEWISWHKTLKENFGKKIANTLWVKAWSKRGNSKANTGELRNYMASNGVNIDSGAWDKVVDMGSSIGDFIGTGFQAGQYLAIGLGVILVGSLGIALFNLAKKPSESVGLAARAFVMKGK
jgi:hypothetical protein